MLGKGCDHTTWGWVFKSCEEHASQAQAAALLSSDAFFGKHFNVTDKASRRLVYDNLDKIKLECSTTDRGYLKVHCPTSEWCREKFNSDEALYWVYANETQANGWYCPLWQATANYHGPSQNGFGFSPTLGAEAIMHAGMVPQGAKLWDLGGGSVQDPIAYANFSYEAMFVWNGQDKNLTDLSSYL